MTPLTLQLLRRASLYFAVLAVLLLVVPRLLRELGVTGPSVEEEIQRAANAVDAARTYGAVAGEPAFEEAGREAERARELLQGGKARDARRAARRAEARAVDAQRVALARREETRRQAERVVLDVDRRLNELADLHTDASARLPREEASRLFSLMKDARQAGATLFLDYEEEKYREVVEEAPRVLGVLGSVADGLKAAGGRPAGNGPSMRPVLTSS
jgi:hypothetical protein